MNTMTNTQRIASNKKEMSSRKLLLTEPMETDVLCGRGNVYASRPGNKAFQNIIRDNVQAYSEAKGRLEKVDIVDKVMNQIQHSGARIVKIDSTTKQWYKLSDVEAHQKCGHCLRDTIRLHGKEKNNSSTISRVKSFDAIKKQSKRQARTIRQCSSNIETTDNDNDSIIDITSFYSEFGKHNHRFSLLANCWNDDDDNYSINPTTATTATTMNTHSHRRQSSALFADEFPESNIVYSASIFFNQ
mmetsp:Transcript_41997/g.46914  ORF Transcript_41997/g.46914 Transcript_41997/m.46914 type:complete len:244 (-) Transcript_41997:246-977(-)